jgi:hypothetical protein
MRFQGFSFGSIRIDGVSYDHDVVIDRGEVRKRKTKASKKFLFDFIGRATATASSQQFRRPGAKGSAPRPTCIQSREPPGTLFKDTGRAVPHNKCSFRPHPSRSTHHHRRIVHKSNTVPSGHQGAAGPSLCRCARMPHNLKCRSRGPYRCHHNSYTPTDNRRC